MNLDIINKKNQKFSDWYREIITKGELVEYYDVKGCYVLMPNAMTIWNNILKYLDAELKLRNVENYYFPLFVTKKNLEKEQTHLEGFKAEVAWIKDKEDNIAIRPTSECIICPVMAKRIRSHQDLPKKVNQYVNVFRDEIKETMPFIRSREFLWQEGHSFYGNKKDAEDEVTDIINLYKKIYEDLLAVPVILGLKTKMETFSGAEYTYTVESYIPEAHKGIQGATSHYLEHNFSKMFDIKFLNDKMKYEYCHYNSWGITTRSIGVMIQTHSDDKGLVFPPKIAPVHIVIIPVFKKNNKIIVLESAESLKKELEKKFSVVLDVSKNTPGYKYNYWELRGVPLRVEIGEKEVLNGHYTVVRRDNSQKSVINKSDMDQFDFNCWQNIMDQMHNGMFNSANSKLLSSVKQVCQSNIDNYNEGMILAKFCGNNDCESMIKEKYGVKSLCLPQDNKIICQESDEGCVVCGLATDVFCLFGKSY